MKTTLFKITGSPLFGKGVITFISAVGLGLVWGSKVPFAGVICSAAFGYMAYRLWLRKY